MNYRNVRFKWGNGKFVESAKEPSEGFEKITYEDPKSKKEKVTYHKYHDSINGTISSVRVDETKFGSFLKVNVKVADGEMISIQLPYEDNYGYSRETRAMISSLRGYEIGEEVSIKPLLKKFKRKSGADGRDVNFFINYTNRKNEEGNNETTGFIAYTELPPVQVEEKRGKKSYNNDEQMDFYYQVLQDVIARFGAYWEEKKVNKTNGNTTSQPTEEPVNVMQPNTEFDEDDLPF